MLTLRIRLFGPFEVLRGEQPLAAGEWRSQQTRAILKVLAARCGHVVPTDQLLELLWPGDDPDAARRRLHVRVSELRRALDPDDPSAYVLTVEGGYTLNPGAGCWIDTVEFETCAQQGRHCQEAGTLNEAVAAYETARTLYRGDFLAEDLYEDWTSAERERLRECFLTALTELAECYAQQGRYRRAIARCQQVLATDPCREAVYVRLMLYHYYAGEQDQALRTYERCRRTLADELDVPPLPATTTLAEQIRAGTLWAVEGAPRYPPPAYEGRLFQVPYSLGHTPFVGRDREYAWLVEGWRDPQASVLLVEGEAGVGKSRLMDEFLGYAAAQGATVLRSRMAPGEGSPYAPVVAALHPLLESGVAPDLPPATLAVLVSLFPTLRNRYPGLPTLPELPARQEQDRLFGAVEALMQARAPGALLCVDDAHRASAASFDLLTRLANTLTVVLSYRSEETPPAHPLRVALRPLRREGRAAGLTLGRLVPAATQALIRQLAGADLPGIVEQVIAQTAGNPLFVIASLQHLFETGTLYVDAGGRWAVTGDAALSLPPTVRETIEARLRRLSRDQRRVFDLAAVIGGEFDSLLLQCASRETEDALLDTLDELLEAGLLVEPRAVGRGELALAHDLYAEVAYDTLPSVRRRQLHRRVGAAIEQVYALGLELHYANLAYHYGRAEDVAHERRYARLAGEQAAARFANAEAVTLLSRALELTPGTDADARYDLLLARERVYDMQGERALQLRDLETLEAMVEAWEDDRRRAEVSLRRATYAWTTSDFPAAIAVAQETIHLARRCQAVALEAASYLLWGRSLSRRESRPQIEKALALARSAGLRWMEGEIVRSLGIVCFGESNYAESKARFEQALSIHREVGDRRGEVWALNNLGLVAQVQGDPAEASAWYEQAWDICHEIGDRLAEGVLTLNLGSIALHRGDHAQARAWYERSLTTRREIGDREGEGLLPDWLAEVARQQGDYAKARMCGEQALQIARQVGTNEGSALVRLGLIQRDLGDYAGARTRFEQALDMLRETTDESRVLSNLGLLDHLLGDDETAQAHSRQALEQAGDDVHAQAAALTNLGHALAGLGHLDEAVDAYRQALDLRCQLGQPHLATEPLAGLARIALAQGDLAQAQEHVAAILAHLETGTLDGTDEPFRVYLTCYQVLQANQDARAEDVLTKAHQRLQERAAAIEDEKAPCSFLDNVAAHREIVHAWTSR